MGDDAPRMIILNIGLAILFLFGICTIIASLFSHIDDLGRVRVGPGRIQSAKDRVDSLKVGVTDMLGNNNLDKELMYRANRDNPIAGIVESLDRAIRNVEREVNRVQDAKERITSRKAGPLYFIVNAYGDGE